MSTVEIRDALSGSINAVIDAVRSTIEVTPPELVADLMYRGIALAGGGALLRGLDRRLAQETRFPVYVAEDPLLCVVKGTGEVLEEAKMLQKVQSALATRKPPRYAGVGNTDFTDFAVRWFTDRSSGVDDRW